MNASNESKKMLEPVDDKWMKDAPPHMKEGEESEEAKKKTPMDPEFMKDTPPHMKKGKESEEAKKKMPTVNTKNADNQGSEESNK